MTHSKQTPEDYSFQPILKSKYLVILVLLGILAILTPSYLMQDRLWVFYLVTGFIALVTLGLHQNVRFQKLHSKFRPFIVVRFLQILATIGLIILFFATFIDLIESEKYVPYLVYYLLSIITVSQFYSIFRLAKKAKQDFPDRCEFC